MSALSAVVACSGPNGAGPAPLPPAPTGADSAQPRMSSQNLLYISEYGGGSVDVFTYPQDVFALTLSGLVGTPQGMCVDKKGNLWVVEIGGHPTIQEFAHGGSSPMASLSDQGQNPYGCAVNPITGDLAVSSEYADTAFQGSVEVWKKAKGTPTVYIDKSIELGLWCGYDNKGNLFFDGLPPSTTSEFALAEIPKGHSTFTDITLKGIKFPGYIQWDGSSLTIGDPSYPTSSAIRRVSISGTTGTITGTTVLKTSYEIYEGWIQGNTVIGPDDGSGISNVQLWNYPKSGKPKATLSKGSSGFFNGPFGAAVSPAK